MVRERVLLQPRVSMLHRLKSEYGAIKIKYLSRARGSGDFEIDPPLARLASRKDGIFAQLSFQNFGK